MVKLILKLKETQIDEFNLEKSTITIGRSQENEIVIDNVAVSRRHAQLELKEGKGYVLRDLGSSNGTFLNGVQIDANDHELNDGDVLGIAKFEILVKGLTLAPKAVPKVPGQPDVDGTLIYEAPRRKPSPEPAGVSEPKGISSPVLKAISGPSKGKEYKLAKEITTLGKNSQDDISVGGWFVSPSQAKIRRQGDRFYISHKGGFFSSTKVNGVGIKKDHLLKNQEEIVIGNSTFVFIHPAQTHG